MTRFLFISKILLLGLSTTQVLSTLQVYISNTDYHKFLTSIQRAGYLAVPNEHVVSTLRDLGPAFCGGLFFTLTTGATVTIISSGLAKALGVSRTPDTRESLHRLLDDPHFNVVCMAMDSLGRRGNRADIPLIVSKIEASHNWYEQWYAYRALRRLGWRQGKPS